jgi:hypothetical protein
VNSFRDRFTLSRSELHLPSGQIAIEEVSRFLIHELRLEPKSEDRITGFGIIRVSYLFSGLGFGLTAGASLECTPTTLLYSAFSDGTQKFSLISKSGGCR